MNRVLPSRPISVIVGEHRARSDARQRFVSAHLDWLRQQQHVIRGADRFALMVGYYRTDLMINATLEQLRDLKLQGMAFALEEQFTQAGPSSTVSCITTTASPCQATRCAMPQNSPKRRQDPVDRDRPT